MTVIVQAQDLSRNDHGCYTTPSISEALDVLFAGSAVYYLDPDGDEQIEREYIEECHRADGKAIFYNEQGESLIIT
jgi:hypothetical protein